MHDARAFTAGPSYPVVFVSNAASNPCPSTITINGQSLNLGSNCSAITGGGVSLKPISQTDLAGATVVIGPGWTQACNGRTLNLDPVTWTGAMPAHGKSILETIHTWQGVCPGTGSSLTISIISSQQGDNWQWNAWLNAR